MDHGEILLALAGRLSPSFLATLAGCALWAWISLSLILRMWLLHTKAAKGKKIWWTLVLTIPLFGWLCYGALFEVPGYNPNQCPTGHSSAATAGGGGGGGAHGGHGGGGGHGH